MKKALLVVSFGTSYPETRIKTIEACEKAIQAICPERDFFRTWTSNMIRKKVASRDQMIIDSPKEALERLIHEGYTDVAIQSLHVINGDEYEKITTELKKYESQFEKMVIGTPLLSSMEDFNAVIEALQFQSPKLQTDEYVVLMGHGATHHAFTAYGCMDHLFMDHEIPFILGAVESYPEIDSVIKRLQQVNAKKAHLFPFMIVAGDHATNDMASDEEGSWKCEIENAGIATECYLQGLGENTKIQALFAQHLIESIERG